MAAKKSLIAELDIPSLQPSKPRLTLVPKKDHGCVDRTDWEWMLAEAALSGGNKSVQAELRTWEADHRRRWPARADLLIDGMKSFVHRHLYTITEADIEDTLSRSRHSYGGVTGADRPVADIHLATSPAPISLMLHSLLETTGRIPTWQEFQKYHWEHPGVFLTYMVDHARRRGFDLTLEMLRGNDWLRHPVARAIRFRLGTAYNSFIRELHFMCVLRERYGIFLTHHFLLDAVWKIDFLYGDIAIEVFLESRWKQTKEGDQSGEEQRVKVKCFEKNPARDVVMVTFFRRQDSISYNRPWLLTERDIAETARRLHAREVDYKGRPCFRNQA